MNRNSTNFAIENYNYLKSFDFNDNPDHLLYNQFIVEKYLLGNPQQRGLLVMHDYGRGKTRLAAQIAKIYALKRRLIFIVPSGVKNQYIETLERVKINQTNNKLQFIALKASNLIDQLDQNQEDDSVESDITQLSNLENTFVVIDEAHNIFNSICNGAKNALSLYDTIMNTKNIKLLFLSGNPASKYPFELVPCFNMLSGTKLFSESKPEFEKWFISEDNHIKNKEKFKNRIMGLVSYYGSWIVDNESDIAEKLPLIIKKIPMSMQQFMKYKTVRQLELEQKSFHKQGENSDRFNSKTTISSYRIYSRKACNLATLDPKFATDKEILDPENSCKFYEALKIINSHKGQIGMTGDNLVHHCGLEDFSRLLQLKGWENWEDEESNIKGASPRFALITGDQSNDVRTKIQNTVSSKENIKGDIIRNVLVGPAGSEGLNFHNGRYVILMSPHFNMSRNNQFIYRFIRKGGHKLLDIKDQNVQPYLFLADYPNDEERKKMGEPTTDVFLYEQSKKMQILILEFIKCMIEASIDCPVHRDNLSPERQKVINCKMCVPDGKPLWQNPISLDMQSDDTCKKPEEEEIDANELIIEDTMTGEELKYMYSVLPQSKEDKLKKYEFFEFKPSLNMYVKVKRNHPNYNLLYQAAIDL
jgi:hypothetical protein